MNFIDWNILPIYTDKITIKKNLNKFRIWPLKLHPGVMSCSILSIVVIDIVKVYVLVTFQCNLLLLFLIIFLINMNVCNSLYIFQLI
jgi:hypothetical protein